MALDIGIGRKKASAPAPAPDTIIEEPAGEPFRYTEFAPLDAPVAEQPQPVRRPPGTQRLVRPPVRPPSARMTVLERLVAWKLPLIGNKPVNVQVQVLLTLLAVFAVLVIAIV